MNLAARKLATDCSACERVYMAYQDIALPFE
jgi:hypothetical protein